MQPFNWDDRVIYLVTELFFSKDDKGKRPTTKQIEERVRALFPAYEFSRERVYPHVARAAELGMIRFIPPPEDSLAAELTSRFHLEPGSVHVVNTPTPEHGRLVADRAADLALELIRKQSRPGQAVGLGLGPGHAALNVAERLGELLRTDPTARRISLYAIAGGGPARHPDFAPASFFTLFPRSCTVERVGMFTESLVPAEQFESIKTRPGVVEVFDAQKAGKIHIVISSMGDFEDLHDLTRQYLVESGIEQKRLKELGWVGNVQYRPYTADGPVIETGKELRAATLFELQELVEFVQRKDRHVILIARQCGICGATRHRALRPLLEKKQLRVFSELVTDAATARELLNG